VARMPEIEWRIPRRGDGITHAFEAGRRYSYCGRAERVAESLWRFSSRGASGVCLCCVRVERMPPSVTLAGLIY